MTPKCLYTGTRDHMHHGIEYPLIKKETGKSVGAVTTTRKPLDEWMMLDGTFFQSWALLSTVHGTTTCQQFHIMSESLSWRKKRTVKKERIMPERQILIHHLMKLSKNLLLRLRFLKLRTGLNTALINCYFAGRLRQMKLPTIYRTATRVSAPPPIAATGMVAKMTVHRRLLRCLQRQLVA